MGRNRQIRNRAIPWIGRWTALAAAVLIALMLLLATAKTYRRDIAAYVSNVWGWRWSWSGAKPDRVPAD